MTPSQFAHQRLQLALWGCGIGFALLFFIALLPLAGFVPPPTPQMSGAQLMAEFGPRLGWVKLGIVVGIISGSLMVPWSAVVALQIARMEEGRRVPLWAIFAFGAGMVNAVAFVLPFIFWAGAFYRPDRSPELVQLINDLGWLSLLMYFPTFSMQLFCVAMAGFTQRQGPEVFPRWFLYLNLWMATIGAIGVAVIFFFSGPLAWNGIFAFWIPIGSYGPFLIVTFIMFYRTIVAQKDQYVPTQPSPTVGAHTAVR